MGNPTAGYYHNNTLAYYSLHRSVNYILKSFTSLAHVRWNRKGFCEHFLFAFVYQIITFGRSLQS